MINNGEDGAFLKQRRQRSHKKKRQEPLISIEIPGDEIPSFRKASRATGIVCAAMGVVEGLRSMKGIFNDRLTSKGWHEQQQTFKNFLHSRGKLTQAENYATSTNGSGNRKSKTTTRNITVFLENSIGATDHFVLFF